MKRTLCSCVCIAIVCCMSMLLSAQQQLRTASDFLDQQNGVTESDLVARALDGNPTLRAARQQIAIARGDVAQARLRKNPTLNLSGLKEVNGADNRIGVGGSLPLELFGRRARRTEVAEKIQDATQQSVADEERLLAGEVRTRFGQALASIRDLMFAEQLLQVNRDFLRLMQDRVREGATPPLEADETSVEVHRIESQRIESQSKAEVALLSLKETVGMEPEAALRLKGALELAPLNYSQSELIQLAMAHRPDLAYQRANEALANAELHQDTIGGKPDATLSGAYERPDSGFAQRAFDSSGMLRPIRQTFNYATFGLTIDLPVFDRKQGAEAADAAAVVAARSRVAAVDLALRHEVARSLVRLDGAQARVAVYSGGVRDQAAHNLDIVRQTYSYGRTTLLDVIAEQRRYIDIETGYTALLLDAYTARAALEQAVGSNLP